MRIKCHSFLNIYIRQTLYGRDFANEKKLCDGEKPDDIKGVDDESSFCKRHLGNDIVDRCQGGDYCIIPVTGHMDSSWQKKLDSSCAPLKKELRVDYICGEKIIISRNNFSPPVECFHWASYVNTPACMDTALIENSWVTEEDLVTLSDTDKRAKLTEALYLRLNPDIHSKPDLGKRLPASDQGGLCGLAALQHALGSTVATASMLRGLDYDGIRRMMASEIGVGGSQLGTLMDAELLTDFYTCKYNKFLFYFQSTFVRVNFPLVWRENVHLEIKDDDII